MAPRSTRLAASLNTACSCRPQPSRLYSTAVSPTYTVLSSALLSRPPLLLPALSPFEKTYFAYQRLLHRALSKPLEVSTDWFFKKGSAAEKSFLAFDARVSVEKGDEAAGEDYRMGREGIEGAQELIGTREESEKSLERRAERTLYLLVKKGRSWGFPQGGVKEGESLLDAAQRQLVEETGSDMDVWAPGRVPAGAYEATVVAKKGAKGAAASTRTFFLPMRIIRGSPVPPPSSSLADYAWCTKEEVAQKVDEKYYAAVEDMLSDR